MISSLSRDAKFTDAKILIVDDEQGNIHVLERMLNSVGYQNITSTTDSRSTPEIYETMRPDLILLDIKMPGFSGFDVMNALRTMEKESYLPILVLTAQLDTDTRLKAIKAGAKDFVNKPFIMEEMLARINNLLEVRMLHNCLHSDKKSLETRSWNAPRNCVNIRWKSSIVWPGRRNTATTKPACTLYASANCASVWPGAWD